MFDTMVYFYDIKIKIQLFFLNFRIRCLINCRVLYAEAVIELKAEYNI